MRGAFLRAYLAAIAVSPLIPAERGDPKIVFDAFLLPKAVYKLGYKLDNRPYWVKIPIMGIKTIISRDN